MLRLSAIASAMPRGVRLLLAVCAASVSVPAGAQVATQFNDPLVPQGQTDPRNPPSFQQPTLRTQAQLNPPTQFTPPASGAGVTGFDSTNARKLKKPPAKANANTSPNTNPDPKAIAPGQAAAPPVSPYQKPATDNANGAFAAANGPGMPPVELGPIQRPPKKRKAHEEPEDPYAPIGVRAGSFMLYPAIEFIGGHDSNPGRAPDAQGAWLYTVAPEVTAQSNWSRHEVKADLHANYTGYNPDQDPTLSRPYVNGKIDGRIDVTHLTRIDLDGRLLVSTDNPGSPNLQAGLARLPVFATYGGNAGIGQQFGRFDLSVKGDVERTAYQDSQLTDGTTASNADRNYNQYSVITRLGYETSPGITPFVQATVDTRKHDLEADIDGYERNSNGVAVIAGSSFKLRGTLTGEIGIGYGQRTYEDPRLPKLAGLIGESSLVWTASALTTVKLSASSIIGESTLPGVSGVIYRDVGLQVDHAFRRWLIGTVKLGFGLDSYKGGTVDASEIDLICGCVISSSDGTSPDRVDKRFSAGLGLTYKFDRNMQIKSEVRQDWLRSNVSGADYTATIFLLGLRFQE